MDLMAKVRHGKVRDLEFMVVQLVNRESILGAFSTSKGITSTRKTNTDRFNSNYVGTKLGQRRQEMMEERMVQ